MPFPLLALAGSMLAGAGLGYLAHREQMKAYKEAMGMLQNVRTPAMDLIEDIQKYGLRYALEKYGYEEVRKQLETAYKGQISSILARTGRQLALAGVPAGINQMAVLGKMREGIDIGYLQQVAGLPFEMLQAITRTMGEAFSEEFTKASAIAGLTAERPSMWQDILAGAQVGAGVFSSLYGAYQNDLLMQAYRNYLSGQPQPKRLILNDKSTTLKKKR